MSQRVCRWGILGTATIARKNWQAIRKAGNATLAAVASRDLARSEQFIAECNGQVRYEPAPRTVGSYEELLASDDVDAVYVPLPTAVRKQWVIRAAEAGKHIVCEKPCGVTAADVRQMLDACRQNNVQFMDGVMFTHSARLPQIHRVLADGGSVGQIKRIASQFSFRAPDDFLQGNIRTSSQLEPLGCLGDLGWYNIRVTLSLMGERMPVSASGRMLSELRRDDCPAAVPMEFSGEMFFDDGVSASFYCSFVTEHQQWVHVSGTKGYLDVSDFVLPYFGSEAAFEVSNHVFDFDGCNFNMRQHTRRVAVAEYSNSMENSQETNLFRNFSERALSGQPDASWADMALKTQRVMDACLDSAGQGGKIVEIAP